MYKMDILKKIGFILLLLAILKLPSNDIASSNQYLESNTYQLITVNAGDSVWGIATKYVTNKDDIRYFILSIKYINHLDNNLQIYPGQALKIPLPAHNIDVAQK